mgnify:CR=1 FL=1
MALPGAQPGLADIGIVGGDLLKAVMLARHQRGGQVFFLGATPAGFPLYEALGYRTVFEAQVWVRGETSQA